MAYFHKNILTVFWKNCFLADQCPFGELQYWNERKMFSDEVVDFFTSKNQSIDRRLYIEIYYSRFLKIKNSCFLATTHSQTAKYFLFKLFLITLIQPNVLCQKTNPFHLRVAAFHSRIRKIHEKTKKLSFLMTLGQLISQYLFSFSEQWEGAG